MRGDWYAPPPAPAGPTGTAGGRAKPVVSPGVIRTVAGVQNVPDWRGGELPHNLVTLSLSQNRLKEQTETLVQRMFNRGVMEIDSTFRLISGLLGEAAKAMEPAKAFLDKQMPDSALAHEQKSLQLLLRAEAVYREVQVQQQQQGGGGGGGGGGGQQRAQDLADLFEQAAADGTPVREIVGEDPVEFAEAFLRNYPAGHWITRERDRLTRSIQQAAGEVAGDQGDEGRSR